MAKSVLTSLADSILALRVFAIHERSCKVLVFLVLMLVAEAGVLVSAAVQLHRESLSRPLPDSATLIKVPQLQLSSFPPRFRRLFASTVVSLQHPMQRLNSLLSSCQFFYVSEEGPTLSSHSISLLVGVPRSS